MLRLACDRVHRPGRTWNHGRGADTVEPPPRATATTAVTSDESPSAGGLLVLDGSGNVAVLAPDGGGSSQITDDAGAEQVYLQPTWSPRATGWW